MARGRKKAKRRAKPPKTTVVIELHLDLGALVPAERATPARDEPGRDPLRVVEQAAAAPQVVLAPAEASPVSPAVVPPEAAPPETAHPAAVSPTVPPETAHTAAAPAAVSPTVPPETGEVAHAQRAGSAAGAPAEGADGGLVEGGPSWPLGPHYLRWVAGKGSDAWARYKLKSADWYLKALEVAEREVGLDRYVGVEMAIDGVLGALCAGVDAAGHALLEEVDHLAAAPGRPRRPEAEDWTGVVALAARVGAELGSARAIAKALGGVDGEEHEGWLTQLRHLQRVAVRRNVLVRRPSVEGGSRSRLLDVPGLGQRPVIRYLETTCRRVDGLVEALLTDVESLAEERLSLAPRPSGGGGTLPNLAQRADVLGARWHGLEHR